MRERIQSETNRPLKGLLAFYAWVHKVDSKIGFPRPVTAPTIQRQRLLAIILLICQTGITFTGALVRVTGSGLGCDTWPQCHPGSLFPVAGANPWLHQLIEFGNRTLTFVLIIASAAVFIAVVRAARRPGIIHLAFVQGLGIIVQAVIGGVTVLTGLTWWMVLLHFLPSMLLVFLAARLVVRISEPDDGTLLPLMPRPLGLATTGASLALAATLFSGTLVTSAGPHSGDADILSDHRLQIDIDLLAHVHAHAMYLYLGLTLGLLAGLFASQVEPKLQKIAYMVVAAIVIQGAIGMIQYWLGVPRWTVPLHVIGSGITTAVMGLLWSMQYRVQGGSATVTGSPSGDGHRDQVRHG